MSEALKAIEAKIKAGPTSPSRKTRQQRRRNARATPPAKFTERNQPHPEGSRSWRRSEAGKAKAQELFEAALGLAPVKPLKNATKKGAVHPMKFKRPHIPVEPSSHTVRRQEAIRAAYGHR